MMDSYRTINRELSLHNQELRIALNTLKREITNLNNQLFQQRKQFTKLKDSIAVILEKKHCETMSLIYPERISQKKSLTRTDLGSHRRSCENFTATDALRNRMHSPPARSPMTDLMVDANLITPIPKIVVHRDARISRSLSEKTEQNNSQHKLNRHSQSSSECHSQNTSQRSENTSQNTSDQSSQSSSNLQHSVEYNKPKALNVDLNRSQCSLNNSLQTITEDLSNESDTRNDTITDATINNLLDAPCSTPYNTNKVTNTTIATKDVRVLVQKLSVAKIQQLKVTNCSIAPELNFNEYNTVDYSISRKDNTFLKVDTWHRSEGRKPFVQIRNDSFKNTATLKKIAKENEIVKNRSPHRNKSSFKENNGSESDFTCSEDESTFKNLRPKRKVPVCLKEPSLRQKLRNTTNLKLK